MLKFHIKGNTKAGKLRPNFYLASEDHMEVPKNMLQVKLIFHVHSVNIKRPKIYLILGILYTDGFRKVTLPT